MIGETEVCPSSLYNHLCVALATKVAINDRGSGNWAALVVWGLTPKATF